AVAAGRAVGLVRVRADARAGIARAVVVALSGGGADDGVRARAGARLAGVGLGAGVAVAAGRAVGLVRVRADARAGIARPDVVALIESGADDGVRARAHAALASIGLGAGVGVVAGRAVGLVRIRADARAGVAR